ncbi:alpha/beta hydrolase [Methylomonas sp. SURF-2]|uniref:Alpha/beta hydrolase n=1 Tax=Methylomonas subterranea TaxID=2952225 RepID=A0ABT1TC65_9GAMM|nr:alpha/beta hydrolase [Methylomonas sp. SURF-2]MCQ8103064.1 alpha/beta hydrolase [Methylomonas sp. SURF-2]
MSDYKLYYATNRKHKGSRWQPDGYGKKFSDDGMENLRFGVLTVAADDNTVEKHLNTPLKDCGVGDGENLAKYLAGCAAKAKIAAYEESIKADIAEQAQADTKLGSKAMFADLMQDMKHSSDVLIYIHGFNVAWTDAVGSALALQLMLRNAPTRDESQTVQVVLFSWPSDGLALPWVSYKSDRSEASGSGAAVGRGFLKLRDFLADLRDKAKKGGGQPCGQDIHLLCHSMGNFLLQSALARIADFTPGNSLPRIFEHVFLCAPDVDDNALEPGQPLGSIDQIARNVSLYHNRGDTAMVISDYSKGNPERLGGAGAAHPAMLHNKVHQIDCTPVVHGLVEHSYYLSGKVAADIRASIDGWEQGDARRERQRGATLENVWAMRK